MDVWPARNVYDLYYQHLIKKVKRFVFSKKSWICRLDYFRGSSSVKNKNNKVDGGKSFSSFPSTVGIRRQMAWQQLLENVLLLSFRLLLLLSFCTWKIVNNNKKRAEGSSSARPGTCSSNQREMNFSFPKVFRGLLSYSSFALPPTTTTTLCNDEVGQRFQPTGHHHPPAMYLRNGLYLELLTRPWRAPV